MQHNTSRDEIIEFLNETEFTGYQSVPLPYGLRLPGDNPAKRVTSTLGDRIKGKSLLDIGTYYGLFPAESMLLGARRAVGLEADKERYRIARKVASINGDNYEILFGRLEESSLKETFDVVLLLNVLHHVLDPIEAVKRAVGYCNETLIIEFCLPYDHAYIRHTLGPTIWSRRINSFVRSQLLRLVAGNLPLMAVGNREYHRTFYFSPAAFHNLFVVHHKLFSEVKFLPSEMSVFRKLAICKKANNAD